MLQGSGMPLCIALQILDWPGGGTNNTPSKFSYRHGSYASSYAPGQGYPSPCLIIRPRDTPDNHDGPRDDLTPTWMTLNRRRGRQTALS